MKVSIWVFLNILLPEKETLLEKWAVKNIFAQNSMRRVFDMLKEAGVAGMELLIPASVSDEEVEIVKKIAKRNAFPILSVHQSLKFFSKISFLEIKRLFKIARMLDAKVIVLHLRSMKKSDFTPEQLAYLHMLEESCNIQIGFENSQRNLLSFGNAHAWEQEAFAYVTRKSDFHITFDTCHLAQAGGDIIQFFKENKERIVNIHLSDYKKHPLRPELHPTQFGHLPIGAGDLPLIQFLETLKKENYKGLLTLEINSSFEKVYENAKLIKSHISS